tara:strand:- start:77 stop:757 length:681 start_codon:yes stop_codon:yes gene_type:complete
MHFVYLHGFGSSPDSSKARFLRERLEAHGATLYCPDFNEPDFATLTVSRMLDQVDALLAGLGSGPSALIGSSLGALVALHAAERQVLRNASRSANGCSIARLVLLAPALTFGADGMKHLGHDGVARWRATDRLDVEHHAEGRVRQVHFALYTDAQRYDSFAATMTLPTLILQGRRDEIVDPAMVEQFAAVRDHVALTLLDDDHQLKADLDRIWHDIAAFLGVVPAG